MNLVEAASFKHERFEVTRDGKRSVVVPRTEHYDALIETIEVLADPDAVRDVHRALAEFDAGNLVTREEMRERMRKAARDERIL